MLNQEKPIHIIAVALLLIAVQVIAMAEYFGLPIRGKYTDTQVFCTQEAKLCPDGSAVGRTGSNCEFAECAKPSFAQIDTSNWQTYRDEEYGFEFKYPVLGEKQKVHQFDNNLFSVQYYDSRFYAGYLDTFGIFPAERGTDETFFDWFTRVADKGDSLIRNNTFSLSPISSLGKEVYKFSGPVPDDYEGGSLPGYFIFSKSNKYVFAFSLSQDHDLYAYGYSQTDQRELLKLIVTTFKFIE